MRFLLAAAMSLILVCSERVAAAGYTTGEEQYEIRYEYSVPKMELTDKAEIWIPLAVSDKFQVVSSSVKTDGLKVKTIHDRDFGNKILRVSAAAADTGKPVTVSYNVVRKEKSAYQAASRDNKKDIYLRAEPLIPLDERFKKISETVTAGLKTDLEKGRAIYQYVLKEMKYDKSGTGWGRGDAVYACDVKTGNCTDFHALFIALARSAGIPSRFAIGFTIPAQGKEGKIEGYHCWAEFLAAGKWIPIDISEASKEPRLTEYYFGHHPANRFQLSEGRAIVTSPPSKDGPINFLVHPYVEINGKTVKGTTGTYTFKRTKDPVAGL